MIILGSIIKVIELPLAGFNESAGFAIWYLILTGIPEILLLINIFNPNYFLIFDYGYEYKNRDKKPYASLIRTYKEHHLSTDPLDNPGQTDITYDVNFTFLGKYFESKGYEVQLMYQFNFLDLYGYKNIYKELKDNYENSLDIEKLKIKSELVGLEAINNERGLGGFYTIIAEKI